MRKYKQLLGKCIILSLWFFIAACEEDNPSGPDTNGGEFRYGEVKSFQVSGGAGTQVADPVSGSTFFFPAGGNGTLTLTPITSSPQPSPSGTGIGYKVEFTSSDSMSILVPYSDEQVPMLWVWTDPEVSLNESNSSVSETWVPLRPQDSISNPAVFKLIDPSKSSLAKGKNHGSPMASTTYKVWQDQLKKASVVWTKHTVLKELTRQHILDIYNLLPTSLQTKARAEIDGRLAPRVFMTYIGNVSFYHPFVYGTSGSDVFRWVDPYFTYSVLYGSTADPSTVAHEVGHYMSHVLLGDNAFYELSQQAVRNHDIGMPHAGRPMLEEYAMFSDYSIYGEVKNGLNMEEPYETLSGSSPKSVDWPSNEGYATCLLARLHTNKNNIIIRLPNETEDIPVVGASLTDLWSVLGNGPRNVNALRLEIGAYLDTKGMLDKLPVILERTGWTYHGSGKVVNDQKQGLPNLEVQSISKVGSENKEYLGSATKAVTDKDGNFKLDRIFPGSNYIRVWTSKVDSMDFPLTVDPNSATNASVSIGELVYGNLNDRFVFSKFIQTGSDGIIEEPMSINYDLPRHAKMLADVGSCKIDFDYYSSPKNKDPYIWYLPKVGDDDGLPCGSDDPDHSPAVDIKSSYNFSGSLTSGVYSGVAAFNSVGTERYAMTWYVCEATITNNKVIGTLIYHSRRYIPDPQDDQKMILKSEGSKSYSFEGTRE